MMEIDMAGAGGGWYDGRRFGGGRWREDGADGLVLLELLLEVGVPVVLDVIVGPLREVRRNGRPFVPGCGCLQLVDVVVVVVAVLVPYKCPMRQACAGRLVIYRRRGECE